jgi:phosphate transport system permease protein
MIGTLQPGGRTFRISRSKRSADRVFQTTARLAALGTLVLLAGMFVFLIIEAWPALSHYGPLSFLTSSRWAPSEAILGRGNPYGILQFVYGTLVTSLVALLFAVPVAIAIALFVNFFAPVRLRRPISYLIDLLAAIPSVVYGFWGIFALIPTIRPFISSITDGLSHIPLLGGFLAGPFFGPSYFTASLVLAIMVLPIITAVCREIFRTAPSSQQEAAFALGSTRWEMIRLAVLPRSRAGITGACILGLGRALGETIAVTMVIGNSVLAITQSIFGQGATMSSVMANEFTEATEPYHLASLFMVAFWLLMVSVVVNIIAHHYIKRVVRV